VIGRTLRRISTLTCLAGLAIGTLADDRPARTPVRSGEFWILAGDFHVHAFPGDGSLTPSDLRGEALRAGLDVIAITNHNQIATGRFGEWIASRTDGPILIGGEEITNPDYHLIAVGVRRLVRADQGAVEAIDAIHAQGAVAIAAHPTPSFRGWDDLALALVDGTEVAHPSDRFEEKSEFVNTFKRARRLNPHVAPIGSSDIHVTPTLGSCRTFVFARERSITGALEAIRAGRTVAADESGTLYGNPDLIARVQSANLPGRAHTRDAWRRLSLFLTWVALAAVLLFG
jgi:predicted metal-dependent phosphoesterase TrpH